jgi:hypothetical protein
LRGVLFSICSQFVLRVVLRATQTASGSLIRCSPTARINRGLAGITRLVEPLGIAGAAHFRCAVRTGGERLSLPASLRQRVLGRIWSANGHLGSRRDCKSDYGGEGWEGQASTPLGSIAPPAGR